MTIIRGTNANIKFNFGTSVDLSNLQNAEMYIAQAGNSLIKQMSELLVDTEHNTVSYMLTQEESLALVANRAVEITIIGLLDGKRFETRPIIKVNVENTRKNEVMNA